MKKVLIFVISLVFSLALVSCSFLEGGSTNNNDNKPTSKEVINEAMTGLFADVDMANVENNLNFVAKIGDVEITYESQNLDVISNTGEVTRGEQDVQVTVLVTLKYKEETTSTFFRFTVKGTGSYEEPPVEEEKYSLTVQYDNTKGRVTASLSSLTDLAKGTEVTLTITALEGFEVDNVTVNGTAAELSEGKLVVTVNEDTRVNITFKEKVVGPVDPVADQELVDAITAFNQMLINANYKLVELYLVDGIENYTSTYHVFGDVVHYFDHYIIFDDEVGQDVEYTDEFYVFIEQGEAVSDYYEYDGKFYEDSTGYMLWFNDFYLDYYGFKLNALNFEKGEVEGTYVAKADKLNEAGKAFFMELDDPDYLDENDEPLPVLEVFKSFTLYLENGKIVRVVAVSDYSEGSDTYETSYDLTFSEVGEQSFELPEVSEDAYTIADIYDLESGDEVSDIYGYVAGFSNDMVYIVDEYAAIVVYFPRGTAIPANLEIGQAVSVSGTLDIYNGLYEIKLSTSSDFALEDDAAEFELYSFEDLSLVTAEYMNEVVNFENVHLDSVTVSTSKDTTLKLIDASGNELALFIKKADATAFETIFKGVNAGQVININNVAVSYFKNNIQLRILKQTSVEKSEGISLSFTSKTVEPGKELAEVLADLVVKSKSTGEAISSDQYQINGEYSSEVGTYTLTLTCGDFTATITIVVREVSVLEKVSYETLDSLADRHELTYGLPSTGDVEILVIPVAFTNSKEYTNETKLYLEKAFNGTAEETGWHSLRSYYQEVSFGKLNLHANILDPYQTGDAYDMSKGESGVEDYKYLVDSLRYYDELIDYTRYDQNNDGYIDTVYLVYLAPYSDNLWWAYNWEFLEEEGQDLVELDGLGLDWYLWMSIEFFEEAINTPYVEKQSDLVYVDINCETVIHETGHALGLDDYYDYVHENYSYYSIGGLNMMDYNQGDQDPFSKAIMGWINPTVVDGQTTTVEIGSYTRTGDSIWIGRNSNGTYFDEYFIICFYTPDGVNEIKKDMEIGIASIPGVVIYHVNSTLQDTLNPAEMSAIDIYKNNNGNKTDRLIKIVEPNGQKNVEDQGYFLDESLFQAGDQLVAKWNDGKAAGFTIKVVSTNTDQGATIEITFN